MGIFGQPNQVAFPKSMAQLFLPPGALDFSVPGLFRPQGTRQFGVGLAPPNVPVQLRHFRTAGKFSARNLDAFKLFQGIHDRGEQAIRARLKAEGFRTIGRRVATGFLARPERPPLNVLIPPGPPILPLPKPRVPGTFLPPGLAQLPASILRIIAQLRATGRAGIARPSGGPIVPPGAQGRPGFRAAAQRTIEEFPAPPPAPPIFR